MPPVAAADASKATHKGSSTHSSSSSPNGKNSTDTKNTRLCHIVKRADFDGYGFNLHSEKSKIGQYIGKIDENSPAEAAGLKEGDRIIEVNGISIGKETHKEVVQRIKAIAWEVKLLVTSEAVTENSSNSPNKSNSTNSTNSPKENKINNEQNSLQADKQAKTSTTTNNGTVNSTVSAAYNTNNVSPAKSNANSTSPTTPPPPLTPPTPSKTDESSSAENLTQKPVGVLKLPSTAAEMRAILQSKKKHNPKSDDVNLQKKYDIIQKL